MLGGIGGFGALFEVPKRYQEPVLISGTDDVGTKLRLAFDSNRHVAVRQRWRVKNSLNHMWMLPSATIMCVPGLVTRLIVATSLFKQIHASTLSLKIGVKNA